MSTKWTAARRAKFRATMAAKRNGGAVHAPRHQEPTDHLPPALVRALEKHFRRKFLAALLRRS